MGSGPFDGGTISGDRSSRRHAAVVVAGAVIVVNEFSFIGIHLGRTECYIAVVIPTHTIRCPLLFAGGCMKKFMLIGVITGVAVAAIVLYLRRKELEGTEFREFFDSSAVADDLFGDAFQELPDKI
jgi:hypothetical protein